MFIQIIISLIVLNHLFVLLFINLTLKYINSKHFIYFFHETVRKWLRHSRRVVVIINVFSSSLHFSFHIKIFSRKLLVLLSNLWRPVNTEYIG